ncbi:EF-hand domain-containing protein [Zavarzinia sp.]|uniref:EF-hand domain-containing protein n=1 Tax=Zavarzinia sp. TaxID=2027920 RepID=UPI0035685118
MQVCSPSLRLSVAALVLPLGLLAACGDDGPVRHGPPPGMRATETTHHAPPTSLAGRILSSDPKAECPDVTASWLKTADKNGDDLLELDEALGDATALFAEIDTNHDHFVTPAELTAYRDKTAPAAYADQVIRQEGHSGGADPTQKRETLHPGGNTFALRGIPDPVMAADANLDFRVTEGELAARVKERFAKLDTNHDGKLDADELAAYCPEE